MSRELLEVSTTSGMLRALRVPELRDRHLKIAEDLQQERLELRVGLVDLVDEQHDRLRRS